MFHIKTGWTRNTDPVAAVRELAGKVKQPGVQMVGFFASPRYDFAAVAAALHHTFPGVANLGCTTAGEVVPDLGYTEGTITAFSVAADDFTVAPVVLTDIKTRAMLGRNAVSAAAESIGLTGNNGFGMVLIDGMQEAEEKVMMALNAALPGVPIVGGSAGDDLAFKETKVACNGEVYANAAVVALVRTNKKLFTYRENIYVPTGIDLHIDEGDPISRTVTRINGITAATAYATAVGCPEAELERWFQVHPVGRVFGSEVWITSPQRVMPGGAIKFYTQIMPGTTVRLLQAANPVEVVKETADTIRQHVPNCKGILAFNCILRYLQFKTERNGDQVYGELAKVAPVVGFTTYGEQYFKQHVNQTLTLIAVGEE